MPNRSGLDEGRCLRTIAEESERITTQFLDFLNRCAIASDGFLTSSAMDGWRLGALAHVTCGTSLAMVRKAQPQGRHYEFGNLWTLPGGMVRSVPAHDRSDPHALVGSSLCARVAKEAGLDLASCADLGFSNLLGPLVSAYTTSGGYRHTLMVVRRFSSSAVALLAADPSVTEAGWVKVPPDWSVMAPANLVAVAHLAWPGLTHDQHDAAAPHVIEAVDLCSRWAMEVEVPEVPLPWADEEALAAWRSFFR